MTDKPTYQEGDVLKIRIDRKDADMFNNGDNSYINPEQILSHEKAERPKLLIRWINVYGDRIGGAYEMEKDCDIGQSPNRIVKLKITFFPETKMASVEVV